MAAETPENVPRLGLLNIRLSDVLLTLLIPASLYALTFTYQAAYFKYFFLPTEFVELDWSQSLNVLTDLGWLLLANAAVWFIIVAWFAALLNLSDAEFYKMRFLLFFLLLYSFSSVAAVTFDAFLTVSFVLVIIVLSFVAWWRYKKVAHTFDRTDPFSNIAEALVFALGKRNYVAALIVASSLFIVYDAGWNKAANQTEFLVTKTMPREAVLAATPELFITAPYVQKPSTSCSDKPPCYAYKPEYRFEKIPQQGSVQFYRKALGKLSVLSASAKIRNVFSGPLGHWYFRQRN